MSGKTENVFVKSSVVFSENAKSTVSEFPVISIECNSFAGIPSKKFLRFPVNATRVEGEEVVSSMEIYFLLRLRL